MSGDMSELLEFVETWQDDQEGIKKSFVELMTLLRELDDVRVEFHPRPGLTYSMRGVHAQQGEKPLFVMVDVIEGDPRWLSVCFYSDMISDNDKMGDYVPGGLLGEDGTCFDLEEFNQNKVEYLKTRIREAYKYK